MISFFFFTNFHSVYFSFNFFFVGGGRGGGALTLKLFFPLTRREVEQDLFFIL